MHVTYRILEHYHAFHFFQPPFLNGLLCFANCLRHIVKTKASLDAYTSTTTSKNDPQFIHLHLPLKPGALKWNILCNNL